MNATIPMLLVSSVATGFAPRSSGQQTHRPNVSPCRPVDVSVEGLGVATRGAPSDGARHGGLALTIGPVMLLECARSIRDQATGACLQASSTPASGQLLPYPGINNAFQPPAFVGGGEDNQATGLRSTIAGGRTNRSSADYAAVGGGRSNTASGTDATVAGGRSNGASDYSATIGGGRYNVASRGSATVGGGVRNTASGVASVVAGGTYNRASRDGAAVLGGYNNWGYGTYAVVGGGRNNTASGYGATVGGGGGGLFNPGSTASGSFATIPGGAGNTASGIYSIAAGGRLNGAAGAYSFAAGQFAQANHRGAFVWADSQGLVPKHSSVDDEFTAFCSGGARFFTNSTATTGVLLAPGGSTWTMVSDRDAKENVEPVDAQAILDKVAALPLASWNYKAQDDSIRHMGPMAQDFYAAFGLGLGEKTIDTIDPNGVALAAIQGLNAELEDLRAEKDAEIEEAKVEIEGLRAANAVLLARVKRLEGMVLTALEK